MSDLTPEQKRNIGEVYDYVREIARRNTPQGDEPRREVDIQPVSRDEMTLEQRAAWDKLMERLLSPPPTAEEER